MTVSIVIPTLNEQTLLAQTLGSLSAQAGDFEVVLVDGGSTDETVRIGRESGMRVLESRRGRAAQMNVGAAASRGDVLLFLHADTRLPAGGVKAVAEVMRDERFAGGCFRLGFDSPSPILRVFSARIWMGWTRLAFGDRAIFCRRSTFDTVGGFPDQPIFEDLDFVRHLRRHGQFAFLPASVATSGRRFETKGPLRQQLRNLALWGAWTAGVPARRLAKFYEYP